MQSQTRVEEMQQAFENLDGIYDNPVSEVVRETLLWVLSGCSDSEFFDAYEHAFQCHEDDKAAASRQGLEVATKLADAFRGRG